MPARPIIRSRPPEASITSLVTFVALLTHEPLVILYDISELFGRDSFSFVNLYSLGSLKKFKALLRKSVSYKYFQEIPPERRDKKPVT